MSRFGLAFCAALLVGCSSSSSSTPDASGSGDAGHDAATDSAVDASVDAATDSGNGTVEVLSLDFEGATLPANVNAGSGTLSGTQGYATLGSAGHTFEAQFLRSPTANTVTVTFTDLPAHTSLSVSMLFAAIDSLDGSGTYPAGDFFRIDLDGTTVFRESFANAIDTQIQSYSPPADVILARRVDLGFGGPGGYYTDSAYDFGRDPAFRDFPHTGSTATLTFTLEGQGVQSLDDESWAIDDLRISVGNTPVVRDGGANSGT